MLFVDDEKSSMDAFVIWISTQRRPSYVNVSALTNCLPLFACFESSIDGAKALLKRFRIGQLLTIMKKRHSKSTVALNFL